jgi:hypothetical protein
MRQVINLSLPAEDTKAVKALAQERGFDSVSGYIQYLIEQDKDLISAEELLQLTQEANRDYKNGKAITVKSMADLLE